MENRPIMASKKAKPCLASLSLIAAILLLSCSTAPNPGLPPPFEAAKDILGRDKAGSAPILEPAAKAGVPGKPEAAAPPPSAEALKPSSATARPSPGPSGLKAAFSDDNAQFGFFLKFLEDFGATEHQVLAVEERILVTILDVDGRPVANARVQVFPAEAGTAPLASSRSYADGGFALYPREYSGEHRAYRLEVDSPAGKASLLVDREGPRNQALILAGPRSLPQPLPVDILFVLDTTGSMGEEIERLRATLEIIYTNIAAVKPSPSIRFGLVLYRDKGDEYLTRKVAFTADLEAFQRVLDGLSAGGGGDNPEDLQAALEVAVRGMDWREGGLKLAFVITDAAPHLDYGEAYGYAMAAREAKAAALKIFTIGTGGLAIDGEYVLRQLAQYTEAAYIFLTYGERKESEGGKEGSVSHHSGENFNSDKLEAVVIRFVKQELAHFSDSPRPSEESFYQADKTEGETGDETLAKLFSEAIGNLADYSGYALPKGARLAVMPIVPTGGGEAQLTRQAEYFGEQLSLAASASKLFTIVERKNLETLLSELELQLSGLVDDKEVARVGKLLGADFLVTGTIYEKGGRYELYLKLLRVETGEVLSATKAKIDKGLGL